MRTIKKKVKENKLQQCAEDMLNRNWFTNSYTTLLQKFKKKNIIFYSQWSFSFNTLVFQR